MFVKLFSSILDSSIWDESDVVVRVWVTMLAMSDRNGFVAASCGGIAARARKTKAETHEALSVLMAPDPDSRSLDHEGRRVMRVDGGYLILNYRKYRELRTDEERRLQNAEAQERYRKRCNEPAENQPGISQGKPGSARGKPGPSASVSASVSSPVSRRPRALEGFEAWYKVYPRHTARAEAAKAWGKLSPDDRLAATAAVVGYAEAWRAVTDDRRQYIPHPATWLNGGRWTDDPEAWRTEAIGGNGKRLTPSQATLIEETHRARRDRERHARRNAELLAAEDRVRRELAESGDERSDHGDDTDDSGF